MLKPSDNPPILCPWAEGTADLRGTWWVAHTKSRNEKAFAWDLLRSDIGYFLPLYEHVHVSGGRKRRVMMPLFPSYIFVCGDDEDHVKAMRTNRVCQTIRVVDQKELLSELQIIEKAVTGKAELDPYPHVAVGQTCRITSPGGC